LAAVADIGASTASGHFLRLREQGLVEMLVQGRHRYYRLANPRWRTRWRPCYRLLIVT